jgi:hypothetical protein
MDIASMINTAFVIGGQTYRSRNDYLHKQGIQDQSSIPAAIQGIGITAMIAPMFSKMAQGAMYSAGADPLVGQHGFGFAVFNKELMGKGTTEGGGRFFGKSSGGPIVFGNSVYSPPGGYVSGFKRPIAHSGNLLNTHAAGLGTGFGKSVLKQTIANSLLPIGMTAYFAADAYASDGTVGLGKYLVADILGNYYGTQAGLFTGIINDVEKAAVSISEMSGISAAEVKATEGFVKGAGVQRINPIARSGMIGRMAPVMGGIVGATVGMELGATAGSMASSIVGYDLDSTMGSIGGGFFGAVAGAKFGSYALSSIPRAIATGFGIAATTAIASNTMSAIEAGFENINQNRGLNYAGQTAAYFTRNAVTMRERAMQSIHKSHLNARSAFGQEASLMHMNRDMFSQYKRAL